MVEFTSWMVIRTLGFLLVGVATICAEDIHFGLAERNMIDARFARLRTDNPSRGSVLQEMFAEVGCKDEHFAAQPVKGSKLPNLVCTLPGSSDRTVVVSAHYDKVTAGEGAIDNWSGAAMLPSLYESLSGVPRQLTIVFVLFTDEEKGLVGSRAFVRQLSPAQRRNIAADINIDSVGLSGAINIWNSRADRQLVNDAVAVASSLHIDLHAVNVDDVGASDSFPFRDARIPVIDFHSITQGTFALLHTSKDVRSAVDGATYYETYRLLTALLAYLDSRASHVE